MSIALNTLLSTPFGVLVACLSAAILILCATVVAIEVDQRREARREGRPLTYPAYVNAVAKRLVEMGVPEEAIVEGMHLRDLESCFERLVHVNDAAAHWYLELAPEVEFYEF